MTTILGKRASPEQAHDAPRLPPIRNRHRFHFMSHPLRWRFDEADADAGNSGWLPILGRMNLIPGVNGITDGGNIDLAVVGNQRQGWSVIFPTDARLGASYMNYTQQFPSRGKTRVWASIFDSVTTIGNRAIWKHDDDGYRAFLRFLVDSGIVPDIEDAVRENEVDDRRTMLEQSRGRLAAQPNNPALARRIEIAEAKLMRMAGDPEPQPKPKRRKP